MNTPVKIKKPRTNLGGTPIPSTRRKPITSTPTVYNPPVSQLKSNYEAEFAKFLKSVKSFLDYIDKSERDTLSPMRRQLRRFHKESNNYDVYFKSQGYWKFFYKGLINRCDDIMDCFRFGDLRDVHTVVESHHLPVELVSFVTQQLMEWRDLFKDVEWMKAFKQLNEQVNTLQEHRHDQELRLKFLRELSSEFEYFRLDIRDFQRIKQNPEQISNAVILAIEESEANRLKNPYSQTTSDLDSDESSSDAENSSLFIDAGNSNVDDANDFSNDEAENDNDFEAFFNV